MNNFWKTFWEQYVENAEDDPFSQVGRTLNKSPMSKAMFLKMAARVIEKLKLKPEHLVLDLCCGNGLLSVEVARHCQHVVGMDFSEKLINDMRLRAPKNVECMVGNVLEATFQPASFHRIIFAAALQQFTQEQVIRLFKDMVLWLKPGGILLITDITDNGQIWNFYDSPEREKIYFQQTMEGTSALGTWFDRVWLEKLAMNVGFSYAQALDQPEDYWYEYYRFDLFCRK